MKRITYVRLAGCWEKSWTTKKKIDIHYYTNTSGTKKKKQQQQHICCIHKLLQCYVNNFHSPLFCVCVLLLLLLCVLISHSHSLSFSSSSHQTSIHIQLHAATTLFIVSRQIFFMPMLQMLTNFPYNSTTFLSLFLVLCVCFFSFTFPFYFTCIAGRTDPQRFRKWNATERKNKRSKKKRDANWFDLFVVCM